MILECVHEACGSNSKAFQRIVEHRKFEKNFLLNEKSIGEEKIRSRRKTGVKVRGPRRFLKKT
jgi:hypothetical protein